MTLKEKIDYKILREAQRLYGFQRRGNEYKAKLSAKKLAALRAHRDNMANAAKARKMLKEEERKAEERAKKAEERKKATEERRAAKEEEKRQKAEAAAAAEERSERRKFKPDVTGKVSVRNETAESVSKYEGAGRGGSIDYEAIWSNPAEYAELLRASFPHFLATFHRDKEGSDFQFQKFHFEILKKLDDLMLGRAKKKKLYIGLAPRMGKSQIMKFFVARGFALNPRSRFIVTSYGEDLVKKFSFDVMSTIESPLYKRLYGIELHKHAKNKEEWETVQGGAFRGAPLGGVIRGYGAGTLESGFGGAIIVDDYMKKDSNSAWERQIAIDCYNNVLLTRRNSPDTPIVVIAQRMHQEDLVGWLMENEPEEWDFYIVPTLNEDGTSIWEDRITAEQLTKMRDGPNKFTFWSQYQQQPIVLGGDVIRSEWFRYYDVNATYAYKRVFISADTAFKANEWNDYSAFMLWGMTVDNKLHLLDLEHLKMEAADLKKVVLRLVNKYRGGIGERKTTISGIYIEDKASGIQLVQDLKRGLGLPVIPIKVVADKYSRILEATGQIQAGNVLLPQSASHPISRKVLSETEAFRADMTHRHDDICDAMAHGIKIGFARRGWF